MVRCWMIPRRHSIAAITCSLLTLSLNPVGAWTLSPLLLINHNHPCFDSRSMMTNMSKEEEFELPKAVSALPGSMDVEEQPIRNPIDSSSVVLIIGGTRGIGLELVRQCVDLGATVIATHRGSVNQEVDVDAQWLEMDVSNESSIQQAAQSYKSSSNFRPLTHIIHSAGVYYPQSSFNGSSNNKRPAAPAVTSNVMMKTFQINTVGPLLVAQHFVPLLNNKNAVVALLSSKVGSIDDNGSGGSYAYRASKSALNNVAKSLSIDLAGIATVVLLHPGYVKTDMTNQKGLIDTSTSVSGMLSAIQATDSTTPFRFVDYKANLIPW